MRALINGCTNNKAESLGKRGFAVLKDKVKTEEKIEEKVEGNAVLREF